MTNFAQFFLMFIANIVFHNVLCNHAVFCVLYYVWQKQHVEKSIDRI